MFVDHSAVHQVMMDLSRTAHDECFSVIAYCFMPDHLHLLAAGTHPAADFRQFMRIFKQRSAYRWKQQQGTALWQRSYFDRVLRSEEDTVRVARYLLENPIRAGLATRPEDYPYLGSMTVDVRELLYSVQL